MCERHSLFLATLAVFAFLFTKVHAETIVFTYESTGASGNIGSVVNADGTALVGGTSFTNADVKIAAVGDTDDVTPFADGSFINHQSVSIDISGVGVFTVVTPTLTFVNTTTNRGGFTEAISFRDLSTGPTNGAFANWGMTTSIGPISGNDGEIDQWGTVGANGADATVNTSGGRLIVTDQPNAPIVFTATLGPPAPLLGDVNLNGTVNFFDIAPFISILSNGGFQTEADVDLNGLVNFFDIAPFIGILSGQ